jgi:NIMA (never in mitosis gene a)-related kinase
LKCLHDNHILHRDLKLANIFVTVTEDGFSYKIGDMNISKITHGQNAIT